MDTKTLEVAAQCFQKHPRLSLRNISCHSVDGVLVLQGSVSTYHLKQLAQEAVAKLDGVEEIENQIHVLG